ncbi:trypco2 family protein [Streptomyces sp. NPDC006640]|uniref:trypco2 family protein n=1 Tax=unclassified Streptomyces TaxID=2593676 RepID=UPI0036BF166F
MSISLVEALAELRRELYAAQVEGANEQFQFEVERAELSLEVEFRRDGKGGVKVEVGALGAKAGVDAGGGLGSTRRQVLTLTLQVQDQALGGARAKIRRSGRPTDTGDSSSPEAQPDAEGSNAAADTSREGAAKRPWES